MSLWKKILQLPPDSLQQVREIYNENFPIEVRDFMADWIEENMWTAIEVDNPDHEQYVSNTVATLINELQVKIELLPEEDMVKRLKLNEAVKMFQQRYSANPFGLYQYVRRCLLMEMSLVQGAEAVRAHCSQEPGTKNSELFSQMETMRLHVEGVTEDIRRTTEELEMFAIQYDERIKNEAYLNTNLNRQDRDKVIEAHLQVKVERLKQSLQQMVPRLIEMQIRLLEKLHKNIVNLNLLQGRVLDTELRRWKREQQLSGNGAAMISNLNTIQEWCERLAGMIWQTRRQVKEMGEIKKKLDLEVPGIVNLPILENQITQLLSTLVKNTFVIEEQPPQVIKTNTGFTSTVRLLVGGQLSVHMTPPQVKVIIISESQAQALLKSEKMGGTGGKQPTEMCGEILNNTRCMEYQPASRQLSVNFRNMLLKKIKRAEKKGTESVMDEKLSLLFLSQFKVGGGELVFQVWTFSLPVVVIVHGNQEPQGWATVTWDNAFAAPGRIPFAVPDKVTWLQMAETLNLKFTAATGSPLSEDHLRFLAEKLFRTSNLPPNINDLNHMPVSWTQFCKEPLSERNFTFWEWFYSVMKVTREHLRGPWAEGLIHGFLRKKQAEDMLSQRGPGTFLLRFSDSETGGITIAWVGDGNGLTPEVFSLQPFTSRDLSLRPIADRVSDLIHLTNLYPDRRKDQAFAKFYTPPETEQTSRNGYVKPLLVTQLPWSVGSRAGSYAGTPHHAMQSPDSRDTPCLQQGFAPSMGHQGQAREIDYHSMDIGLEAFEDYEIDFQGISAILGANAVPPVLPGLPTPGLTTPGLPVPGLPTTVMGQGMPMNGAYGAEPGQNPMQQNDIIPEQNDNLRFGSGSGLPSTVMGQGMPMNGAYGAEPGQNPLQQNDIIPEQNDNLRFGSGSGLPSTVMGQGMPMNGAYGAEPGQNPLQQNDINPEQNDNLRFGSGSGLPSTVMGQGMPMNGAYGAEPGQNPLQQNDNNPEQNDTF